MQVELLCSSKGWRRPSSSVTEVASLFPAFELTPGLMYQEEMSNDIYQIKVSTFFFNSDLGVLRHDLKNFALERAQISKNIGMIDNNMGNP